MHQFKRYLLFLACLSFACISYGQENDSIAIERLLEMGAGMPAGTNYMVYYARQLAGRPYVGQTLEVNPVEQLVVNTRQLDCTTYVENVLALALCTQRSQTTYKAFCKTLQDIRYRNGAISYPNRLHYFSEWIAENTKNRIVSEVQEPPTLFTKTQTVAVSYMSHHPDRYPMLAGNLNDTKLIALNEKAINGTKHRYIPKALIANTPQCRRTISNGDILAIVTNKAGLDISHIGIAVWHADGLHLLNASQIHKRTIEEPMTLQEYMKKHPTQLGIRVIRPLDASHDM